MTIDYNRAGMLLQIVNLGSADPLCASIVGEAREELRRINEVAREDALERFAERAAEEAKARQAEQLKLAAEKPELEQIEEPADEDDEQPAPVGRRA